MLEEYQQASRQSKKMTKQSTLDLKNLYKLPWSTYNNPNGWIEPTTYCQLACPGCYRGLALPNPPRIHEDLNKMKREIDKLIKIRNIKILSIAGGEPLLYPKLEKLVSYAKKRRIQSRILTNGVALTYERLVMLKNLGVTEVVIHIADYQNRPKYHKNEKQDETREKYCRMFRKVKGVELNFIMTVSKDNFRTLPKILAFYQKNSDVISRVFFTLYRDIFSQKPAEENNTNYVSLGKLAGLIKKTYKIEPCAYLGKTLDQNKPSWLFFASILIGNKTIGAANGHTVEKLFSQQNNGSWDAFPAGSPNLFRSLSALPLANLGGIITGYIKTILRNPSKLFKLPKCQIVILLDTPTLTQNGWDFCNGCPDAILYKGQLVPSCLLERVKLGEKILI